MAEPTTVVATRLSAATLAEVDAMAQASGASRAQTLEVLICLGLGKAAVVGDPAPATVAAAAQEAEANPARPGAVSGRDRKAAAGVSRRDRQRARKEPKPGAAGHCSHGLGYHPGCTDGKTAR